MRNKSFQTEEGHETMKPEIVRVRMRWECVWGGRDERSLFSTSHTGKGRGCGSERVERRVLEKQWEGKEEEENHGGGNTAASELHTLLHKHGL